MQITQEHFSCNLNAGDSSPFPFYQPGALPYASVQVDIYTSLHHLVQRFLFSFMSLTFCPVSYLVMLLFG